MRAAWIAAALVIIGASLCVYGLLYAFITVLRSAGLPL